MTLEEYLRSIDPSYGSQEHQRKFLTRMRRADQLNPCAKDHSGDTPPTHTTKCYPTHPDGRMVGSES